MVYNPNKELKLYYSIGEVAKMFDVNESLLRYWEKEFPIISPKKAGGNVRQYRKEDIENIRLVYHLVKEKGMTLQGAKQKLKMNRETTIRTAEILDRLKLTPEAIQKNYVIAECCKPIPGDDVLGYIGDNNRIIIHKRQCPLATKLKSSYGNRLLAVQWETGKSLYFPVNIYIKGIDHIGLLNKVTEVISQQLNVNIHKLNIESNDGIFEGRIQLFVHDVDDVKSITTNLRKIDEIKTVTRIEKFEDQPN